MVRQVPLVLSVAEGSPRTGLRAPVNYTPTVMDGMQVQEDDGQQHNRQDYQVSASFSKAAQHVTITLEVNKEKEIKNEYIQKDRHNCGSNENQIIIGAFLILIMGFALVLVPVMLFPLLKKQNEVLALGSIVFRGVLEAVCYILSTNNLLFLILLSREYIKTGASEASCQTLGALLLEADTYIMNGVPGIVFPIGALSKKWLWGDG